MCKSVAEVANGVARTDDIFYFFVYKFLFIIHADIECFFGTPLLCVYSYHVCLPYFSRTVGFVFIIFEYELLK